MESQDTSTANPTSPEDEKVENNQNIDQSNIPESDVTTTEESKTKEPNTSTASLSATTVTVAAKPKERINILLKPVGNAPILKKKQWLVDPDKTISSILLFLKPRLPLEVDQDLFFFVNQAFAPSPDQLIRNLYECFGSDGKLILNYSTTTAWG